MYNYLSFYIIIDYSCHFTCTIVLGKLIFWVRKTSNLYKFSMLVIIEFIFTTKSMGYQSFRALQFKIKAFVLTKTLVIRSASNISDFS